MKRLWSAFFGSRPPDRDDEALRESIEAKRRELDQRSATNRARLTEIQVEVLARRTDRV